MTSTQSTSKSNDIKMALGIVKVAFAIAAFIILFAITFEDWPISQDRWLVYLRSSLGAFLTIILLLGILVKITPFLEKIIANSKKSE